MNFHPGIARRQSPNRGRGRAGRGSDPRCAALG